MYGAVNGVMLGLDSVKDTSDKKEYNQDTYNSDDESKNGLSSFWNANENNEAKENNLSSFWQPTETNEQNVFNGIGDIVDGWLKSPQYLDIVKDNFNKRQSHDLDVAKKAVGTQATAPLANAGFMPALNNDFYTSTFNDTYDKATDFDTVPWTVAEPLRRLSDPQTGNPSANPLDWNIIGFSSQNKSNPETKALYEYYFRQEDEENKNGENNKSQSAVSNAVSDWMNPYLIDNGNDASSRESMYMSGDRYRKYREIYGLPGRPVEDIDDNELYSKQTEMEKYGFPPYISSDNGLNAFHTQASTQAINNAFKDLGDLRRILTDYTVKFDGEEYSGKDIDKNIWKWVDTYEKQMADSSNFFDDPSLVTEDSVPMKIQLRLSDDEIYDGKSKPTYLMTDDGRYIVSFENGEEWIFEDENDKAQHFAMMPVESNDDYVIGWKNIDPLVLDDGRKIRADRARLLVGSKEENSDYGPLDIARPYADNPFEDGYVPWLIDMALGSAPLFTVPTSAAQAFGGAMASGQGIAPGRDDFDSYTYSLISENPTVDQAVSESIGNAVMPLTERIWGPLGGTVIPKFKQIQNKLKPSVRYLTGVGGEALEELPGGLVENLMSNGIEDWFANEKKDPNGYTVFDSQGHPVYEETGVNDKIINYVSDWPLDLLGGASLGAFLGAPYIPSYRREYRARNNNNIDSIEDLVANPVSIEFSDDFLDYYDR